LSLKLSARRVLVTGATGFVGGNLVEMLLKRNCSVTCLVRNSGKARMLDKSGIRLVQGDLNNPEALREAVRGVDIIFHIAAAIKAANRQQYIEANQNGTRRLLEAAAEVNPSLVRFVHLSSLSAAGPSKNGHALNETEEAIPISWYGESKLKSEQEVLRFSNIWPVTILRPSAVYGPRDMETLLIFRMIKRGWMFTPGKLSRHFSLIHVNDLSEACIKASETDTPTGEIFFISRPEAYRWEDIGEAIAQALKKHYVHISLPQWTAMAAGIAGDFWTHITGRVSMINSQKTKELLQPSWLCDSSKACACLGFTPAIDLTSGIRKTSDWYIEKGLL
jgi:nucleoside-diphosphate-sugar epimerase